MFVHVTGATCSIGGATARRLASMGCSLALTGKDQDELMELARQCQRLGLSDKKVIRTILIIYDIF